jgi:hypothetical protein
MTREAKKENSGPPAPLRAKDAPNPAQDNSLSNQSLLNAQPGMPFTRAEKKTPRAIAFELSWQGNVSGCRKDSIEESFVTGHDFSRAAKCSQIGSRALAPATLRASCGLVFDLFCASQAAFFQIPTQALSNAIALRKRRRRVPFSGEDCQNAA